MPIAKYLKKLKVYIDIIFKIGVLIPCDDTVADIDEVNNALLNNVFIRWVEVDDLKNFDTLENIVEYWYFVGVFCVLNTGKFASSNKPTW